MKVYLSIDLDYWRRHQDAQSCTAFFQRVWSLGVPIYVTMYHQHLLPHINASDYDTLVNVDYHSDLVDLEEGRALDFNEGTWANFIDWRYKGRFIWRYPSPGCLNINVGYCHVSRNPFKEPYAARWEKAEHRIGLWGLPWRSIKAVGVSLSPNWTGRMDVLTEPLTRLRIRHWLIDYTRADNAGRDPRGRQPKSIRVKI